MAPKPGDFQLVAADLIDDAIAYAAWLASQGFRVFVEPYQMDYPNTPIFRAVRGGEEHFISLSSKVELSDAEDWVTYGKASLKATKHIVAIAHGKAISPKLLSQLHTLGVGVHIVSPNAIEPVAELCAPKDLSLNIDFPTLKGPLKRKLAHSKKLLGQGNWKESFEDACVVLESDARNYLKRKIRGGNIAFVKSNGKPVNYTEAQVEKMTLGGVATAFEEIAAPSQAESRVAQALKRINPNRIKVAHHKHKRGKVEKTLREQAGRDLLIVVNAIKLLT